MGPFPVVECSHLSPASAQRALAEEYHPGHAQFLGPAHPALSKRMAQVRTPPRQPNGFDSGVLWNPPKRFRETGRLVMDQLPVVDEENFEAISKIAGSLFHPIVVRIRDDTSILQLAGRQPDDE